jgi:hypothetical protein
MSASRNVTPLTARRSGGTRRIATLVLAGAAFMSPWMVQPMRGQDQPARSPGGRDGLQVAVPAGRGAAPAPARDTGPQLPAPRNTDGRVILGGATPSDKGVWQPGPVVGNPLSIENIPYQPWARAMAEDRGANELEPHTRCKASGAVRQFLTPYGVEMLELPDMQRVFIFDIGGPHTFRTVYMDGRSHPADFTPTYYGHSVGWWDRDTLVVDTTGYKEGFWMDRGRLPHTSALHTIERFTRTSATTMRYEYTVDDTGAYTRPFTGAMNLRWEAGTELFEYQCQQANYAHELMVGEFEKVDRTSFIVP